MTPAEVVQTRANELAAAAQKAIEAGLKHVMLTLPRECGGRRRMVVFPKPRLYGEVASETNGHTNVWVDAIDLLAWLAAMGLVEVHARVKEPAP